MSYDFEKEYGFKPPRMVGKQMALIIHKHVVSGTKSETIHIADNIVENQKHLSIVGRIAALGSACFKGDDFQDWNDIPKVGDWIVYKKNHGSRLEFRGIDMLFAFDLTAESIIEDPSYVTLD